jgi:hypothetical protein
MSQSLWWQLPGPREFLETLVDDLREGRHIVVLLPEHGPQNHGLLSALREEWREDGAIESVLASAGQTAVEALTERYPVPPGVHPTPQTLMSVPGFRGRVIWVDGLSEKAWTSWREFLTEYQHLTRNVGLIERTIFIAPVVGEATRATISADVGLSVRRWDGMVDRADMLLFSMYAVRPRGFPSRLASLLSATIAQVAVFDPEVVLRLADERPERVLVPTDVLLDVARERRWERGTPRDWTIGTSSVIEGRQESHAALEALGEGVERRLWQAQVAVLFPVIEEHRLSLVRRLRRHLRIPFRAQSELITDPRDLELGHLLHQILAFRLPIARADRDLVMELKEARNHLAHLEPLSPEEILRGRLLGPST